MTAFIHPVSKREEPYDLSTFRVLIVEDFPFISSLMSSSLAHMGVGRVITAHDGNEGKDKILKHNAVQSSQNIDVAIIDWLMPEFSGLDLLQWLRGHKRDVIRFLPVIICSAYTSRSLVEDSRDAGASEVMVKPVSAAKMAHRILYLIDHPRPFIQTGFYFGPCRRRKTERFNGIERRINNAENITESHEQLT